jgi:hypothetical protein
LPITLFHAGVSCALWPVSPNGGNSPVSIHQKPADGVQLSSWRGCSGNVTYAGFVVCDESASKGAASPSLGHGVIKSSPSGFELLWLLAILVAPLTKAASMGSGLTRLYGLQGKPRFY